MLWILLHLWFHVCHMNFISLHLVAWNYNTSRITKILPSLPFYEHSSRNSTYFFDLATATSIILNKLPHSSLVLL